MVEGRGAGEVVDVNSGTAGIGGELGLTEGAVCPACETSGEGLNEEGIGVGDITPLGTGGEFGAVNEGLLSVDGSGILGVLCERGFVREDGIGGEEGGVLGLLCAKFLKDCGGVDTDSCKIRGEELELCNGLVYERTETTVGVNSGDVVEKGLDVMASKGLVYESGSETAMGIIAAEGVAGWCCAVRRKNTKLRAGNTSASPIESIEDPKVGVDGMSVGVAGG